MAESASDTFPQADPAAPGREWQLSPPPENKPASFIAITVRDEGQGIAPDVLPNIFEPYFTTKRQGGTGLGLAIVSRLVQTHLGGIHIATTPGEGIAFTIYLPRKE